MSDRERTPRFSFHLNDTLPVERGARAIERRANKLGIRASRTAQSRFCLPSRASRVRVPSPAPDLISWGYTTPIRRFLPVL